MTTGLFDELFYDGRMWDGDDRMQTFNVKINGNMMDISRSCFDLYLAIISMWRTPQWRRLILKWAVFVTRLPSNQVAQWVSKLKAWNKHTNGPPSKIVYMLCFWHLCILVMNPPPKNIYFKLWLVWFKMSKGLVFWVSSGAILSPRAVRKGFSGFNAYSPTWGKGTFSQACALPSNIETCLL